MTSFQIFNLTSSRVILHTARIWTPTSVGVTSEVGAPQSKSIPSSRRRPGSRRLSASRNTLHGEKVEGFA